ISDQSLGIMVHCKGLRVLFPYLVGGLTMGARVLRFVVVSFAALYCAPSAAAAEPEARIVEAAARQDMATVRTLLKQRGVNVNAARADGVTALLWAAHWNDV